MSRRKRPKDSSRASALAKLDQDRAELRGWLGDDAGAIAIAGVMKLALLPPSEMREELAAAPDDVLAILGKLACMAIITGTIDLDES